MYTNFVDGVIENEKRSRGQQRHSRQSAQVFRFFVTIWMISIG